MDDGNSLERKDKCILIFFTFPPSPVACAAHLLNPAGDDARVAAGTTCTGKTYCAVNQDVVNDATFTCTACAAGKNKALTTAGLGLERTTASVGTCADIVCLINQHVVNHVCTDCTNNMVRNAGDNAFTKANTACAHGTDGQHEWEGMVGGDDHKAIATKCAVNEMVRNHACVACPAAHFAPAGALRVGEDTYCTKISPAAIDHSGELCNINQYVLNHKCAACPTHYVNDAGDDPHHQNTYCTKKLCAVNEYVATTAAGTCTACPADATAAGHKHLQAAAGAWVGGPATHCM